MFALLNWAIDIQTFWDGGIPEHAVMGIYPVMRFLLLKSDCI